MKTPNITPEEVGMVKRAQAGDESAFACIFKRYKGFVENVLFQYLKDMDEAKDVTNIVFLKVYEKLSTFTAYDSFGGWLRIIANNTAIDYLRAVSKSSNTLGSSDDRLSEDENKCTTGDELVNHLTYKQILELFDSLPELKREICYMFYQDGMRVEDISNALNVPTGTIKSVLSRTRRKIKKQLKI